MAATTLILVGGFLGAGKTTLLAQAALRLVRQGKRVGLLTNDQAAGLVDTATLRAAGFAVAEVAGGCFCCRFDELLAAGTRLIDEVRPDVLLAEPVGSCTDLSATVLQPLKKLAGDRFRVAPLTVLADPVRLEQAESQEGPADSAAEPPAGQPRAAFSPNVFYIYRKQLEEADAIVLNKADTLPPGEAQRLGRLVAQRFPGKELFSISALTGDGVDRWLEFVLGDRPAGRQIVPVDYERYAAGEAALGWLNTAVQLRGPEGIDWRRFGQVLLELMGGRLRHAGAEIAHFKLRLTAGKGCLSASLTRNDQQPQIVGQLSRGANQALLLVNLRAALDAPTLRQIWEECLAQAAGGTVSVEVQSLRSFAPARPEPTHRYAAVEN